MICYGRWVANLLLLVSWACHQGLFVRCSMIGSVCVERVSGTDGVGHQVGAWNGPSILPI